MDRSARRTGSCRCPNASIRAISSSVRAKSKTLKFSSMRSLCTDFGIRTTCAADLPCAAAYQLICLSKNKDLLKSYI